MQARLIHSPAASLCIYTLHIILAFKIIHSVIEKQFVSCTPLSLVLDKNWYWLLADFQTPLPWQRLWKGFRRKKNDIVSWNHLGAHFTNLPACIISSWSAWLTAFASDVFFNLVSERLHLASECSSQRVAVGGCFGHKHFPLFLSGTVWYAALLFCDNAGLVADMKAGFV